MRSSADRRDARYRADWLLPIAGEPVRDGWVAVEDRTHCGGRLRCGGRRDRPRPRRSSSRRSSTRTPTSSCRICTGAIPPAAQLRRLGAAADGGAARSIPIRPIRAIVEPARAGHRRRARRGTGLVRRRQQHAGHRAAAARGGHAGAGVLRAARLHRARSGGRVRAARAHGDAAAPRAGDDVRISLAPHAPYSVSPALFQAIRADLDAHPGAGVERAPWRDRPRRSSCSGTATGELAAVLEELGAGPPTGSRPASSPVDYLAGSRLPRPRVLVVHGVQFDGEDLARLRALGATLVSCPRSNVYVGVGSRRWRRSTRWTSTWRSAPTAWPASRI